MYILSVYFIVGFIMGAYTLMFDNKYGPFWSQVAEFFGWMLFWPVVLYKRTKRG